MWRVRRTAAKQKAEGMDGLKEKRDRRIENFAPIVGLLVILGLWFGVSKAGIVSAYVLPTPKKVFTTLCNMVVSGELFVDVAVSFGRVVKGFSLAFVFAFTLGVFHVLVPKAEKYYEYLVQFFRNVPPLSMIPLLILWCGIGETTKTVIIVLAAFFPMYLNIKKGFAGCDKQLLEVGDVFGYSKMDKFKRIILPYAAADILVGMRIGMGYSWRAIIGAEMVAASTGLGHLILFSQQMSRTDKVIAGIFAIGMVGILTDKFFGIVIRKCFKGAFENGWN